MTWHWSSNCQCSANIFTGVRGNFEYKYEQNLKSVKIVYLSLSQVLCSSGTWSAFAHHNKITQNIGLMDHLIPHSLWLYYSLSNIFKSNLSAPNQLQVSLLLLMHSYKSI